MWQRLVDWLALTATERKVILFLAAGLLLGMGIRLYRSAVPETPQFEYRATDSTFAALTSALPADSISKPDPEEKAPGKININTATNAELESLPGIGIITAERIIQHRKSRGPFKTVDELLTIKGITKKRLEQIKNFITIDIPTLTPREE